jgi:hypothetical protein
MKTVWALTGVAMAFIIPAASHSLFRDAQAMTAAMAFLGRDTR